MSDSSVWVPRTFRGMTAMEDPEIGTITEKLRFGDPMLGWDGNAGLQIFLGPWTDIKSGKTHKDITCWQIWMFGQGDPYQVMQSSPGMHLDERVITYIMERDTRYHNIGAEIKAHNDKLSRDLANLHRAKEMEARENLMREFTRRNRRTYLR